MKELEKTDLARLGTVAVFIPFLIRLIEKGKISPLDQSFLFLSGAGLFVSAGLAYKVNQSRLRQIQGLLYHDVERSIEEVMQSQNIRLFADVLFIAPYLMYLSMKTRLTEQDKMILFLIMAGTSIYTRKYLSERFANIAALSQVSAFFTP